MSDSESENDNPFDRNLAILTLVRMGFDAGLCNTAISIFNDDISTAAEWCLRRTNLGTMPKRFKDNKSADFNYTFYNSRVRYFDDEYKITDFSKSYNIILLEASHVSYTTDCPDPRWVGLGDPSLEWIEVKHDSKPIFQPVSQNVHFIGRLKLPVYPAFHMRDVNQEHGSQSGTWFTNELMKMNSQGQPVGNLQNMYSNQRVSKTLDPSLGLIWQALLSYTDKYNEQLRLEPNTPEPKSINNRRIRWAKRKVWTKIRIMLVIHGVSEKIIQEIATVDPNVPGFSRSQYRVCKLIETHNVPKETIQEIQESRRILHEIRYYLQKKKTTWLNACSSVFTMRNAAYVQPGQENSRFEADIYMNDLVFRKPSTIMPCSQNWVFLKNLLDAIHMGDSLMDDYPDCLVRNCVGIRDTLPQSARRNWFDCYTHLTLTDWGKILIKWSEPQYNHYVMSDAHPFYGHDTLHDHQIQAMEWMWKKEEGVIREHNHVTHHGWEKYTLPSGFVYYQHEMGNIVNQTQWDAHIRGKPGGGILAQSVGSGKTKEMLLIIQHYKTNKIWQDKSQHRKTLIIVPTTMVSAWADEIKKWTPNLIVNVYHGNRRKIPTSDCSDVVLTTYRTVCSECSTNAPNIKHNDLQYHVWRRIVLDEGHHIRDMHSRTFKAVVNLETCRYSTKWIITATPAIKGIMDFCAYFAFLRIYPWVVGGLDHENIMHRIINTCMWTLASFSESYPTVATAFKSCITNYLFYQSKSTISLISGLEKALVKDEIIILKPSPEHSSLMNLLWDMVKLRIEQSPNVSYAMRLKWLTWLRRAAMNPGLVPSSAYGKPLTRKASSGVSVVVSTTANLKLQHTDDTYIGVVKDKLDNVENERCPICLDSIDSPTVTSCGHIFCGECINNAFQHQPVNGKRCPCCRKVITNDPLKEIKISDNITDKKTTTSIVESANSGASEVENSVLEQLDAMRNTYTLKENALINWFDNNDGKCLIFTSFSNDFIEKIRAVLSVNDIQYEVIHGNMTRKKRHLAVQNFQKNPDCRAFILTTRSASYGLTLTAASTIIFFEPCMNRSYRQQCIGRIERLGQTSKELKVITFAVGNSVEEKLSKVTLVKNWSFKDIGL